MVLVPLIKYVGFGASAAGALGLLLLGARFDARVSMRDPGEILFVASMSARDERSLTLAGVDYVELSFHFRHLAIGVSESDATRRHHLLRIGLHGLLYRCLHFADVEALVELVHRAHQRLALAWALPAQVECVVQRVLSILCLRAVL